MHVLITVVASNVQLPSDDFLTLDVSPDLTIADLKALIEAETTAPVTSQTLLRDGDALRDDSKTLSQSEIKHGDLLGLKIERADVQQSQPRQQTQQQSQQQQSLRNIDSEMIRQRINSDQNFRTQAQAQDPELVQAASDATRFRTVWADRQRQLYEAQRRANEETARLDDDWSASAQEEIARRIKQQTIARNIELAMDENPESFARVSMLYIDVTVNNVPIKAFVDSGAQTTIMSPDAAERCNITHLIDERYGGIARGVGTAKILGRVHHAIMQLGGYQAASSFTVMEGKDVDLLLGLDMLKRHQMCIDLKANCLTVQDAKIEFLPEHQIPKTMEEVLENEPKVAGPGGTTIGAETGTVESGKKAEKSAPNAAAGPSSSAASNSASWSAIQTQAPPPQASQISEEKINSVMQFGGVGREEAISLLQQADGNPDLAISLLL